MSIVNEALKKAAKAKNRKENQRFDKQEQWVLTLTTWNWRKPVLYGGIAATAFGIGVILWWGFQGSPSDKANLTAVAGKIQLSTPSVKSSVVHPKKPALSDHYQKGLVHYQEKRYKEAEQEFLVILNQDQGQAVAHNNLGLVYDAQGRTQDAILEYLAALRVDPNLAEAMNNLALIYDQQGRAEEAVSLYDRALKIKPDYPEAHLNYAIILERLGYVDEARKHYQGFVSHAPTDLGDVVASVQARLPHLP